MARTFSVCLDHKHNQNRCRHIHSQRDFLPYRFQIRTYHLHHPCSFHRQSRHHPIPHDIFV
ncbi:hypothetical protein BCR42DRAFT_426891 [Absidia repens]|uniref:Uncharacterized protein n=1 Tax=Absidia repens TaxID=90262 RepID=A0A1X2I0B3_9FUNG|nr:hypothetical protein BCR42DRAFT_426891 [Absidia repens]